MQTLTEKVLKLNPPAGLFNKAVTTNLFPDYSENAIKSLVHRAMKNGEVSRLASSLYCLEKSLIHSSPNPFILANLIYEHSFVSMEAALSYHELIPEAVYQISSTTKKRSKVISNPLGTFTYTHVPCKKHLAGVHLEKIAADDWCLIATPLRAIADMVYKNKNVTWKHDGIAYLTESLRIDEDDLKKIITNDFADIFESFTSKRVKTYLKKLKKELAL